MWQTAVLVFACIVAVMDVRQRCIPNVLTLAGCLAGLIYHALSGGLISSLLAAFVGFAVGLALFELAAIGGGDVKLLAALGALLGFQTWMHAFQIMVLVAGLMSLIQVVRHRAVKRTLSNMWAIVRNLFTNGWRAHSQINLSMPEAIRIPFGVAAALGTAFVLVVR